MMDLAKHYESYRKAVLRDALDEGSWYAKQIRTREGTTVYDWLFKKVEEIKAAVSAGREFAYKAALMDHQSAMVDLYEAMVADHLWDYRLVTPQNLLDLIDEQGTNWFKFAKRHLKLPVTMDDGTVLPMLWVPRYIFPWQGMTSTGAVVFDADELHLMRRNMPLAKNMFEEKRRDPIQKIFYITDGDFLKKKPWLGNTQWAVNDFTAPLFLKPEDMQS